MNIYFISNTRPYIETIAKRMDTYINRIACGSLSSRSAVWMKNTPENEIAYRAMDEVLHFSEKKIPLYRSLWLPEDLIWKNNEHLFVLGVPDELKCYVKLLLDSDEKWWEKKEFPEGFVYQVLVKNSDERLIVTDLGFYYNSAEA